MREIGVIVGSGQGGQEELAKAISEEGFPVFTAEPPFWWPRDVYVMFGENYVYKVWDEAHSCCNHFGEGGYFQIGSEFLLVSDQIYAERNQITGDAARNISYGEACMEIAEACREYHKTARIHIAPSGKVHEPIAGKGHKHIDMISLLLPVSRILMVDTYFGGQASASPQYEQICEKEGLKLIRHDGSQDGVWYPLNSLVLTAGGQDLVFVDKAARSLKNILSAEGVKYKDVEMPKGRASGKIRCQTNTFNLDDIGSMMDLFEGCLHPSPKFSP